MRRCGSRESGGMSGWRPRKMVPVECARRNGVVDIKAAAPRVFLLGGFDFVS